MSIDYYTSSGSFELNGALRKINGYTLNEENKLEIEALERTINKYMLDTGIVTYRAIPDDIIKELKVGDIYIDKGFQSTTPLKSAVNNFADTNDLNSILEIQVKVQENVGLILIL
ncbi:MAG: ADP-ribosyltransferase [Ruminococcus sp.]|nr:ADP-ribosyltransferase [Ruminococcus sp.]